MPSRPIDPAELAIAGALFSSVADEMGVTLGRSAHSPNIKERRDYSCAVFDPRGRLVAQAAHIPVHLGAMPTAVEATKPLAPFAPGDIVILNDPYLGGTHLPDITMVSPVFLASPTRHSALTTQHSPIAFVASRAHHADVGGISPGSMPIAEELTQEGVVIPPVRLYDRGRLNKPLLDLLLRNMRNPEERRADFDAQVAANRTGEARLREIVERYGLRRANQLTRALMDYAERMTRAAIAAIPDGAYIFEDFLDDDGSNVILRHEGSGVEGPAPRTGTSPRTAEASLPSPAQAEAAARLPSPAHARTGVRMDGRGTSAAGGLGEGIPIRVTVTISGDNFHADFTGSAPERPTSINAVAAVTRSAVYYVVRCLLDEAVPSNDGCFRPVTLTLPERSVVNAGPPRAVAAGNVETSQRVTDVVLGALAQALPNVIPAASQGTMNNITIGGHLIPPSQATVGRGSSPEVFAPVLPRKERGAVGEATQHSALDTQHSFAYYETIAGGAGGSPTTPGLDAVHTHMTNTLNTPVEALEMAYPFRITEYAVRPGSGGPGRHPGGDGVTRTYEFLAPATVTLQTERRRLAPYALNGGHPGAPGRNTLERADAANVADGFSLPQGGAAGKRALESSPASRPARPEVSKDEAVARPPDPLLPPTSNLLPPKTLPSKTRLAVAPGDRLTIETPGGGGWGRPNAKLKADG